MKAGAGSHHFHYPNQEERQQPQQRHPPASTPFAVSSHSPSAPDTDASWSGFTSRLKASSTCRHLQGGGHGGQRVRTC